MEGIEEVVADKGFYHSGAVSGAGEELRSAYLHSGKEKQAGQRHWEGKTEEQQAVYQNRRRVRGVLRQKLTAAARRTGGAAALHTATRRAA